MSFDKPYQNYSTLFTKIASEIKNTRSIFYGEVVSNEDETDGGRIKVRVPILDKRIGNEDLVYCYPMLPKYFYIIPKVGEIVRIFIEDVNYPHRSRYYLGSIVSQLHKIEFDSAFTALSTTNVGVLKPEKAPSTYPDAKGVYPDKDDVAIIGRLNTDIVLKPNQVVLRAGKHENGNKLKLNIKNPSALSLNFDYDDKLKEYFSSCIVTSDKIALISHNGEPRIKGFDLKTDDKIKIFDKCHPLMRGDITVEVLKLIVDAVTSHIHPYDKLPADIDSIIIRLKNIDFDKLLQKNIVIN
jgi:hypothetical protein